VFFAPHDEAGWRQRDWLPWEVWALHTDHPTKGNAAKALQQTDIGERNPQAFDVFSMGVIHLYMCLGQSETRGILNHIYGEHDGSPLNGEGSRDLVEKMVLDPDISIKMVSKDPNARPTPHDVISSMPASSTPAKQGPVDSTKKRPMFDWLMPGKRKRSVAPPSHSPSPSPMPASADFAEFSSEPASGSAQDIAEVRQLQAAASQ